MTEWIIFCFRSKISMPAGKGMDILMDVINDYLKLLHRSSFKKYKDQINQENKVGLDLIIVTTIVFLAVNVLLKYIAGKRLIHPITLYLEIAYFTVVLFFYFLVLRKKNSDFTKWIYLFEFPVLLIAMFDALYYEANQTTFIFMIFLLVFPVFILDQLWRIILFTTGISILYAFSAAAVEPPTIYAMDMIHMVNIDLLAAGSSMFFTIIRLRMIQYADHAVMLADEDPLTSLYNRSGAQHHVNPKKPCIFIYIDLDKFKGVNDQFGHEEGDHILKETANVLRTTFRRNDVLIRLGGDEFAVYCPGLWSYDQIEAKLSNLLDSIHKMDMGTSKEVMTASIGCAYMPHGCQSLEEMTKIADQAMYEAKKDGKNGYRILTVK